MKQKLWKGYPVEDAAAPLSIAVSMSNLADGVPMDENNCAIACAARQQYGSTEVMIGRDFAYVTVNKAGKKVAIRYRVSAAAKRLTELNDLGMGMTGEPVMIQLNAISPGHRLGRKRERMQAHRAKPKNQQNIVNDGRGKGGGGGSLKETFRSCTGRVHFTTA